MRIYKLKHVPTGLYYGPKKNRGGHLSKTGKFYTRKPQIPISVLLPPYGWSQEHREGTVMQKLQSHFKIAEGTVLFYKWIQIPASDWLLEEAVVNI